MTKRRKALAPMRVVVGPLPGAIAALLTAPDEESGLEHAFRIAERLPDLHAPSREFWEVLKYEAHSSGRSFTDVVLRYRAHAIYIHVLEFRRLFNERVDDETVDALVPGWKRSKQLRERFGLDLERVAPSSRESVRGIGAFLEEVRPIASQRQVELLEHLCQGLTIADAAHVMRIQPATARVQLHRLKLKAQEAGVNAYTHLLDGEDVVEMPKQRALPSGRRTRAVSEDYGRTRSNWIAIRNR